MRETPGPGDQELKDLLQELARRQEKEMTELRRRQWLELKESGATAKRLERHEEERNDLLQDFDQERARYTKEFVEHRGGVDSPVRSEPAEVRTDETLYSVEGGEKKPLSELPYEEVCIQLQILEHIEDSRDGLSPKEREMVRELEERMKMLDVQDWQRATEQPAFAELRQKLAERQAGELAALEDKHKRQSDQSGPSKLFAEDQRMEKLRLSERFEEERGRYAREFFESQRLYSELQQQFKNQEIDKSIEPPNRSR